MIRNRYDYLTPPIRDIKGKETQTRNNWTLMETSLAEGQTDSYFPTKWPNGGRGGVKSILRGHNSCPYFCRGLDIICSVRMKAHSLGEERVNLSAFSTLLRFVLV